MMKHASFKTRKKWEFNLNLRRDTCHLSSVGVLDSAIRPAVTLSISGKEKRVKKSMKKKERLIDAMPLIGDGLIRIKVAVVKYGSAEGERKSTGKKEIRRSGGSLAAIERPPNHRRTNQAI